MVENLREYRQIKLMNLHLNLIAHINKYRDIKLIHIIHKPSP